MNYLLKPTEPSLICFLAHVRDKSAARAGHRRPPESTLLLLGLPGGWLGAVLAQQVLRHKSTKAAFSGAVQLSASSYHRHPVFLR